MQTVIRKWGNSPAVRLPKALLEAARLAPDQPVRMTAEAGRIVIEPVHAVEYSLERLVAGIDADNRHRAVDFGPPVGREVG
jgi:antitoxin MazE